MFAAHAIKIIQEINELEAKFEQLEKIRKDFAELKKSTEKRIDELNKQHESRMIEVTGQFKKKLNEANGQNVLLNAKLKQSELEKKNYSSLFTITLFILLFLGVAFYQKTKTHENAIQREKEFQRELIVEKFTEKISYLQKLLNKIRDKYKHLTKIIEPLQQSKSKKKNIQPAHNWISNIPISSMMGMMFFNLMTIIIVITFIGLIIKKLTGK
ncbi:hypothetical protein DERF_015976 [Dermatophagoides farinae]|uniref:Uncharacterized protein n=1 Tax=Dermatophagoides farinae TaxID=6954 RepID=A0A922KTA3_DERFA|nr:hypothetical protein DERF_015976 [Dermatophagoides farinae]